MSALHSPSYEAVVSPDLARLRRVGQGGTSDPHLGRQDHHSDAPSAHPVPIRKPAGLFEDLRLRRDGARPATVRAARVMEIVQGHTSDTASDVSVTSCVRVFATEDGRATVQVHLEPGPDCPARPVWRVDRAESDHEMEMLLEEAISAFEVQVPAALAAKIKQMSDDIRATHSPSRMRQ